jgi:hypothetical protein
MMITKFKLAALGLMASALLFTACGDKSVDAAVKAVTFPDAPDAAMQTVARELAKGNGGVLWQAMPAGYQSDLNALVQLSGTKIDAEVYDKSVALIGRLSQVAQQQQAFILNTTLAERTEAESAQWAQAMPVVIGFMDAMVSSDLATSAGLQSFEGREFFDTTVSKLLEYGRQLSDLSDEAGLAELAELAELVVTVVEANETEATLQFSLPGQSIEEQVFSKVENRWVPSDLSSQWVDGIADATATLEAITAEQLAAQKPQLLTIISMVEGVLTQIEAAGTQEQFDQALQGAMMPLMGIMMMGQGMGAPSAPVLAP